METTASPTQYDEANALLALINEDEDLADRILKELHAGELQRLASVAQLLASMARCEACAQRRRGDQS